MTFYSVAFHSSLICQHSEEITILNNPFHDLMVITLNNFTHYEHFKV